MQVEDATKRELLKLEKQYWKAIKERDSSTATSLSDDPCVVDGEPLELEAFDSSVWVRRDGKWVCAVHTESPAGDPFGRH
jgi:hypothetical protein